MTGEAEFNEVYFTDTRIPDAERLGEPGDGWRVSLTTLMNERVSIGGVDPAEGLGRDRRARQGRGRSLPDERKDAGDARRGDEAVDPGRGAAADEHPGQPEPQDGRPGAGGLDRQDGVGRAEQGHLRQGRSTCSAPTGCCTAATTMVRPEIGDGLRRRLQKAFLRSRANSIEGGTTEVMKNILGERVLGLPGDVRVDREVPWSQVPRN